ncbi:MAG TPA: SGNH/GDSL hydrolase family protein, partial [Thermodesulfobacteriaceae bacterium]|nr:SGNH/GDSL hydrolase family protein [Thermodesulfobacteriaceae bacterium]
FIDDFSTDTTGDYTVTHTWTDGGTGQFLYDSAGGRANVLTGDNIALQFSRSLPATDRGRFSIDVLPTQYYPSGGSIYLRILENENNYIEISNTDGYGAGSSKKVVNGTVVESHSFSEEYGQNNSYHIDIYFTPTTTMIKAFGDTIILEADDSPINVTEFEIETRQQDAYYDNIEFSNELYVILYEPDDYDLFTDNNLDVKVISNIGDDCHIQFVADQNTGDESTLEDSGAPYSVQFTGMVMKDHTVDAYIVDSTTRIALQGSQTHDQKIRIATGGMYYVGIGDSITFGVGDDISSDDISSDGRNAGGGYTPILNNLLTFELSKPHTVKNEGVPGALSADGAASISDVLARHPDALRILTLYGTNDSDVFLPVPSGKGLNPGDPGYPGTYKDNMQQIIDAVQGDGKEICLAKVPVALARCSTCDPYPDPPSQGDKNDLIKEYNDVIDELVTLNNITVIPPDFFSYFDLHYPDEYSDWLHPNGLGYQSMADLWKQALTQ